VRTDHRLAWRELTLSVLRVGLAMAVTMIALLAFGKPYLQRALTIDYGALNLSYTASPITILFAYIFYYGWIAWLLACAGYTWGMISQALRYTVALFLILFGIVSFTLWVFVLRMAITHYTLHITFVLILGISALFFAAGSVLKGRVRSLVLVVAASYFVINMMIGLTSIGLDDHISPLFSKAYPPLKRTDYEEIVHLVSYLRGIASPGDPIYVVDSSFLMNEDILRSAEKTLYEDPKLTVLYSPQLDSRDFYPLELLLKAKYVVVTSPFQYVVTDPEKQKVVKVMFEAFTENWEIAQDFVRLPVQFNLADGAVLSIYQRVRPTTAEAAVRAFNVMKAYIGVRPGQQPDWIVLSKPDIFSLKQLEANSYHSEFSLANQDITLPVVTLLYADHPPRSFTITGNWSFQTKKCPGFLLTYAVTDANGLVIQEQEQQLVAPPKETSFSFSFNAPEGTNLLVNINATSRVDVNDGCSVTVDWRLKSSLADQNNIDGFNQNINIQEQRIIPYVVQVIFGVEMHRFITAPLYLPPTRHPLWNGKALALPGFIPCHQVGQFGPGTYQAHFPF
jgi:hypothetical protein